MELTEKKLKSEHIYDGRVFKLTVDTVKLPDGNESTRQVAHHNGGVTVLPVFDDGMTVLVKQFRYPIGRVTIEAPAGKLEKDEDHYLAAIRELKEETGITADKLTYCGAICPSPGYCTEMLHIYVATGLTEGENCPDEDEFLNVIKMPIDELISKIMKNEIQDSKTIAVAFMAEKMLNKQEALL